MSSESCHSTAVWVHNRKPLTGQEELGDACLIKLWGSGLINTQYTADRSSGKKVQNKNFQLDALSDRPTLHGEGRPPEKLKVAKVPKAAN